MPSFDSLRGRREFTLAMRRGTVASAGAITVHAFAPRTREGTLAKVGIVVTKKVGKAVTRNRIRRRCKAILRETLSGGPCRWYVVKCAASAATLQFEELRRQLIDATSRASRPPKNRS